jgi:hypothetical protein
VNGLVKSNVILNAFHFHLSSKRWLDDTCERKLTKCDLGNQRHLLPHSRAIFSRFLCHIGLHPKDSWIEELSNGVFCFKLCQFFTPNRQLEGMGAKIGYPDKILNITQLDQDYDGVTLNSTFVPEIFKFKACNDFQNNCEIAGHWWRSHLVQHHAVAEARSSARDPESVPASAQRKVSRDQLVLSKSLNVSATCVRNRRATLAKFFFLLKSWNHGLSVKAKWLENILPVLWAEMSRLSFSYRLKCFNSKISSNQYFN